MRILQLTPGTGNFYCGSCLRDHALVRALQNRGHEVLMVPLYLPHVTGEPGESLPPVQMGGINVFLEQTYPGWRKAPDWIKRLLNRTGPLWIASQFAGMTSPTALGESTVAMLRASQSGEVDRLISWLQTQAPPEVILLSNSLLAGLAPALKQHFKVPVLASFQGEDVFLDGLPEPFRTRSWKLVAQRCEELDHLVAVSHFHASEMSRRLGLGLDRVKVVYPGITAVQEQPNEPPACPVIGFLARMHPHKGLHLLVDAFLELKMPGVQLRIAGTATRQDQPFIRSLRKKLPKNVEFFPNLDPSAKSDFLRGLTVLSVPATYPEAFGLYLLEAWAAGVPVVQPDRGAHPELLEKTGAGLLFEPDNPRALAAALREIISDPQAARRMGEAGRKAVAEQFSVESMAAKMETILLQTPPTQSYPCCSN